MKQLLECGNKRSHGSGVKRRINAVAGVVSAILSYSQDYDRRCQALPYNGNQRPIFCIQRLSYRPLFSSTDNTSKNSFCTEVSGQTAHCLTSDFTSNEPIPSAILTRKEAQSENTSELSDTAKRMNKLVGLPRTVVIPWRDPDVLCSSRRCNAKHNSEIGQMTAMMAILPCWKCIEEALTPVDEGRKD
jgi:hypothetical protein